LEDPYTGEQFTIDTDSLRADYAKAAKEILQTNMQTMRRGRVVDVPIIKTDGPFAQHVISFFERRKRRMR
jgi:hypothetical protein